MKRVLVENNPLDLDSVTVTPTVNKPQDEASSEYRKLFPKVDEASAAYKALNIKPKYVNVDKTMPSAPTDVSYTSGMLADSYFSRGIAGAIMSAFSQGPQEEWGGSDELYQSEEFKGLVKTNKYLDELIEQNKKMAKGFNEDVLRPAVKEPSAAERYSLNAGHTFTRETLTGLALGAANVSQEDRLLKTLREQGQHEAADRYEAGLKAKKEKDEKDYGEFLPWYKSSNPAVAGTAALAGALSGSLLSPEGLINRIPGVTPAFEKFLSKTLGKGAETATTRILTEGLTQSTVNTGLDPLIQMGNIGLGNQKEWDFTQTAVAPAAGFVLGTATSGVGELPAAYMDFFKKEKFAFDATTARAKGIIGEGEQGYFNTKTPTPADLAARAKAADLAGVPKEEIARPPRKTIDVNELAREVDPDTFKEWDRLTQLRDKLRDDLKNNNSIEWNQLQIEKEMSKILDPVKWDETLLPERDVARMNQLRTDLEAAKAVVETPSMKKTREGIAAADEGLRDLIPKVADARDRTQRLLDSDSPEGEMYRNYVQGKALELEMKLQELEADVEDAFVHAESLIEKPSPKKEGEEVLKSKEQPVEKKPSKIGENVSKKFVEAGRPEEESQALGRLWQSHYEALSDLFDGKLGTADELFEKYGPDIEKGVLENDVDADNILDQAAYHGSPHVFDKFTTKKIGAGEGFQAYGHGLYFASAKEVAEGYREKLSQNKNNIKVRIGGLPPVLAVLRAPKNIRWAVRNIVDNFRFSIDTLSDNKLDLDISIAESNLKRVKSGVYDTVEHLGLYSDKTKQLMKDKGLSTYWQERLDAAKWLKSQARNVEPPKNKGRLYHVELAPEEFEYLDHDKPFSQQSELVQKGLEEVLKPEIFQKVKDKDLNGGQIYEELRYDQKPSNSFWPTARRIEKDRVSQAARASEALRQVGIRGIKYLDGFSRKKEEGSHNYVIFDDKDVSITEYEQRGTPEFQEWFGDSKAVDEEGAPLQLYHGTSKDVNFGKFTTPKNGTWFTVDPESASMYALDNDSQGSNYVNGKFEPTNTASRVMPVYLKAENPKSYADPKEFNDAIYALGKENYRRGQAKLFDQLRQEGYDSVSLGEGKNQVWVTIKDSNQIKSVFNEGSFDKSGNILKQSKKGSLTLQDPKNVLRIFKDSDASTAIHETGHQWLEELVTLAKEGEAPQSLVDDLAKVRKWLGNKGEKISRLQHEKFARGLETYMREGKAPNEELKGIFEKFKNWLLSIYKTAKELKSPLNDDIRGVFDRLVASPEKATSTPAVEGSTISPVQGTGELKPYGMAKTVEKEAIEAGLFEEGELGLGTERRAQVVKDETRKALNVMDNDFKQAERIAMGHEEAPLGVDPFYVYRVVRLKAIQDGNIELVRNLATNSELNKGFSRAGQVLRSAQDVDIVDPVSLIKDVNKGRDNNPKTQKKVEKEADDLDVVLTKKLDDSNLSDEDLINFINEIECK